MWKRILKYLIGAVTIVTLVIGTQVVTAETGLIVKLPKPITNIASEIGQSFTLGMVDVAYATTPDYICDGIADDVEIQAALNALPVTGGELFFFGGNYVLTATVTRAINNVSIIGSGKSTYFSNDGGTALFSAGAQTGWVFASFRTDAGYLTLSNDSRVIGVDNSSYDVTSTGSVTFIVAATGATDTQKSIANWICDGTADDVQIQAAIDALPVTGGVIRLVGPIFNCATEITIGDGSNASLSTRSGVRLIGDGVGAAVNELGDPATVTRLVRTGASAESIIQMNGPLHSCEISNMVLDGNDTCNVTLQLYHPFRSQFRFLLTTQALVWGIRFESRDAYPVGVGVGAGLNIFEQVSVEDPGAATAGGLFMDGNAAATVGCCRNVFIGGDFIRGTNANASSIELNYVDNNLFMEILTHRSDFTGQDGHGVYLVQPGAQPTFPKENTFVNSALCGGVEGTSGTTGNCFWSYNTDDGEPIPTIANIYGMTQSGLMFGGTRGSILAIVGGTGANLLGAATQTVSPSGIYAPQTNEWDAWQILSDQAFTLTSFTTYLDVAPGGVASRTFTVYVDGNPTALTVTYGAAETGFKTVTGAVAYGGTNTIDIRSTVGGVPAGARLLTTISGYQTE